MQRLTILAVCFLLAGCPVPVAMDVSGVEIRGTIRDITTGAPIANALVVRTIGRGGFWSTASTYDLGRATSGIDGSFSIPAAPTRVHNVSDPEAWPTLSVFAIGYSDQTFAGKARDKTDVRIPLHPLQGDGSRPDPCLGMNFTFTTCSRIRTHIGWTQGSATYRRNGRADAYAIDERGQNADKKP